jgi:alanine racemase
VPIARASTALPRRAWVSVDLGALERNHRKLGAIVAPARILAVVKADAYGHGAVEVARTLEPLGVAGFGVATLAEGAELREAGIGSPLLVLSPVPDEGLDALFGYGLTPVVSSLEGLRALRARAAGLGKAVAFHLKFDTGMTRLGLSLEEAGEAIELIRGSGELALEGVMSHLAEAEQPWSRANAEQFSAFSGLFSRAWPSGERRPVAHLANSAAALHFPSSRFDWVRIGIALHGYDPAGTLEDPDPAGLGLEPVMSVEAEIVQVRDVLGGRRVGYGGRFTAPAPARIAIVPLGYADGYSWRLGMRAEALVRGRRAPVAGSVSMDLLALDVSATGGEVGERVTLLGAQGEERVSAFELAAHVGTIPYQLLCLFGLRLPRRFTGRAAG